MARLADISVDDLEAAHRRAAGPRESKRLLAAIIYKRGPSAPMIAEWLDTREETIYRWFDRLETEPLDEAVRDRQKPGRPAKLSGAEVQAFREAVARPPAASGFDEDTWSPQLARTFLEREFDVTYSTRHVRRLLADAEDSPGDAEPPSAP